MRVGVVPHRSRQAALDLASNAIEWLREHDVEARVPKALAATDALAAVAVEDDAFAAGLDLVLSFGGDGTTLYAVQLVYPRRIPTVGVNVGQLGYLSEIERTELEVWLPRLVAGEYEVSERMVLEVDVTSAGPAAGRWHCVNEAVLEKMRSGHMIRVDVSINDTPFTSYAADGVIIATPTGSTAYSFSARGPIVSPNLRCLVLTPISPHMLFDRSLVLDEHEELTFVVSEQRDVQLTVDGRELGALAAGDRVVCRAAPEPLLLATLRPRDFHQILKTKFALPDR